MYSEKVMDHFQHPRNVGKIEDADGIGEVGNAKCGDIMKMYIKVDENAAAFKSNNASGKVTVSGSSSVTPVMEKLKEAYMAVNPDVEIEVQQSDSTTGVNSAIEGICDIGMASRELKDSEASEGITAQAIALDGIAVVVNLNNPISDMTSEQVRSIFTGETQDWSDIK